MARKQYETGKTAGKTAVGKPSQTKQAQAFKRDEAGELVLSLAEKDLRAFLAALVAEDERVRHRLVSQYGTPDVERTIGNLNSTVDRLIDQHGRYGFIEYHRIPDFEDAMDDALHEAVDPLMQRGALTEAFEVSYAFLLKLLDIEPDEEYGFSESLTENCTDLWEKILGLASQAPGGAAVRAAVCDQLCSLASACPAGGNPDVYGELWYTVLGFLEEQFSEDDENVGALLDLADDMLAVGCGCKNGGAPGGSISYSSPARHQDMWVEFRLRVMEAQGESAASRFAFAEPYLGYRSIRESFVQEAMSEGDLGRAIALLEEARRPSDGTGRPREFAKELVGLYEETGKLDLARAEVRTLVAGNGPDGSDTYWFKKLKALTPAEEWPALRDELLAGMADARRRRSWLASEGLYDELMTSIENEGKGKGWGIWPAVDRLEEARRFRGELGKLFPERLAVIYREYINDFLDDCGSSRETYQKVADLLTEMKQLGFGKEAAGLAKQLRAKYPRRPALKDELQKAGW